MVINKEKAIVNIKDEYAGQSTEIVQALLEHLSYSVEDISSWDELTAKEKEILPKEIFNKLI